jgi:hypothetical protein
MWSFISSAQYLQDIVAQDAVFTVSPCKSKTKIGCCCITSQCSKRSWQSDLWLNVLEQYLPVSYISHTSIILVGHVSKTFPFHKVPNMFVTSTFHRCLKKLSMIGGLHECAVHVRGIFMGVGSMLSGLYGCCDRCFDGTGYIGTGYGRRPGILDAA